MNQASIPLTLSSHSMAGNVTSNGINLINIYAFSIQVVWASGTSPVGTFKLQGSNDPVIFNSGQGEGQPTNWTDIDSSDKAISGTPGSILYDVTQASYRWVRIVYTATSGSATISVANMNVKGV